MIGGGIFIVCNFVISNNPRLKGKHKGKGLPGICHAGTARE